MPSESDVNALTDWTDAQLLLSVKNAIVNVLFAGQASLINGRSVNRSDLDTLRKMQNELEGKIRAATGDDGWVSIESGLIS